MTHVPPFKESCLHEGRISNDDWLPFFSSKATGDVLLKYATHFPDIKILTLCGHTHSESFCQALPNLTVMAGSSDYFLPRISNIIDVQTLITTSA